MVGVALWAGHRFFLREEFVFIVTFLLRGSYAVGFEFLASGLAEPIGCPGRAEYGTDGGVMDAVLLEGGADIDFDGIHGGATGVGGGDDDFDTVGFDAVDGPDDAEVYDGEYGDFGIGDSFEYGLNIVDIGHRFIGYSGWDA